MSAVTVHAVTLKIRISEKSQREMMKKGEERRNQQVSSNRPFEEVQLKSLLRRFSPDQVALKPPAERDNKQLRRPLGARCVLQKDQARYCAAEIPRKSCNLETSEQRENQERAQGKNAKPTHSLLASCFSPFFSSQRNMLETDNQKVSFGEQEVAVESERWRLEGVHVCERREQKMSVQNVTRDERK